MWANVSVPKIWGFELNTVVEFGKLLKLYEQHEILGKAKIDSGGEYQRL